ncbi:hypothetical protein LCM10_01330 [Rossellomorea aquimaris]|uniref:hypothetical protein n=1 Tax=Rossellomorea aquimaris TaxID=189382 RepID=UPI001CD352AD|nr:hypothetical protein [Rossellomorea aquimaris]MCA1053611.1 hypothetical protein [Rossellomorea aquimaris]
MKLFKTLPILLLLFTLDGKVKGEMVTAGHSMYDLSPSFSSEILPWGIVDEMIPNKSFFTVIDVETGLSFNVQRRAGSKHADVQPITNKDTKMMKKIYNGTWSWDRRAILVLYRDRLIPASMNGMPHGAGALQNGFPGHFCIHFFGSTTHKTPTPDFAHKLMILKAAGELHRYVHKMDPYESLFIMEIAINQHDNDLLSYVLLQEEKDMAKKLIEEIEYIDFTELSLLPSEDLHGIFGLNVTARMKWISKDKSQSVKRIEVIIRRNSPEDQWVIDGKALWNSLR